MTNSVYKIYLDIHGSKSNVLLKAKNGDTGSLLYITQIDGNTLYNKGGA